MEIQMCQQHFIVKYNKELGIMNQILKAFINVNIFNKHLTNVSQ